MTKRTNKDLLFKGVKFFSFTAILMFTAPLIIWQAFKNQAHNLYYPVLILGIIIAVAAIILGFYSLKLILRSIFDNK